MKRYTSILLASLAFAACDDSGSETETPATGGGSGVSTTVEASAQVSSLSEADRTTLCDDLQAYADGHIAWEKYQQFSCAGMGHLFASEDEAVTCAASYESCMADWVDTDRPWACGVMASEAECTVTVAETVACAEAVVAAYKVHADLTCDSPAADVEAFLSQQADGLPAACAALATKCPSEFGPEEE
jgi:hypothetical protein